MIGPAITHGTDAPPQAAQERTTFEDMVARPDPSPYRAATPAFDISGPPNYAAAAKDKAQAELGGETADDEAPPEPPSAHASSRYYPKIPTGTRFIRASAPKSQRPARHGETFHLNIFWRVQCDVR